MLGLDITSKKQRKRSDYGYILDYRTRWLDNDVYSHMNNNVYMHLVDSIVNDYLQRHCGRNPRTSLQVGIVVNSYCDFFGEVAYPNVLECGLRIAKRGRTSVMWEVGIFEKGKDAVKAVGGITHVFCDSEPRRPVKGPLEAAIREGFEKLENKQVDAKL